MSDVLPPEKLLADAAWLKRLALTLAGDADDADDLVQDSWIAAWQRQPDASRSLRPWLAKVARDIAGMRRRSARRRVARESAAREGQDPAPPDVLLAQVRLHRQLADLVLALDEPYRSTIIAKFVEGRTAATIARLAGIPESTVRARVREGLARLRAQLDRANGERKAWAPAVLAFGQGASSMTTGAKALVLVMAVIVVFLLVGFASLYEATRDHVAQESSLEKAMTANRTTRQLPVTQPGFVAIAQPRLIATADSAKPWWEVDGVERHPLVGRVISPEGTPIAGARVEIYGWSTAVSGVPEATRNTDARGQFRFPSPRDATIYRVVASVYGYAGRTVFVDPRAPANEQSPDDITIVLGRCIATAEGIVTDRGGEPIGGATISVASGVDGFGRPSTTTTSSGDYSICLARGDEQLVVGARGYEHVAIPVTTAGRERVDVVLAPGGTVVGRVVDAETGAGVPNAQVFVGSKPGTRRYGLSDADGNFEISDVAAGRLGVNAWTADHWFPTPAEVEVVEGLRTEPITLRLPPGTSIRGIVRAEGRPVGGAVVRFVAKTSFFPTSFPASSLRAIAGSDGRFVAIGVARDAEVRVHVDGAVVDAPVTIDTRGGSDDLVIDVHPLPAIRGHVTRHGQPVADAQVRLTGGSPAAMGYATNTTTTDGAGRFVLPSPLPGTYKLRASSLADDGGISHSVDVVVPSDEVVVVELDAAGSQE